MSLILPDRTYYFGPADAWQTHLLDFLNNTRVSLDICLYSFTLATVVDTLIRLHEQGRDIRLILDLSQTGLPLPPPPPRAPASAEALSASEAYSYAQSVAAATAAEEMLYGGTSEQAQLARLSAADIPYLVGQSAQHNIIHSKYAVRDVPSSSPLLSTPLPAAGVFWGSGNWSLSAAHQNNQLVVESNPFVARAFALDFQQNWDRLSSGSPRPS
jgi:phosphatidylserine/phosphatidylglycerophosphate/cardiolipin synthase-like enzyme